MNKLFKHLTFALIGTMSIGAFSSCASKGNSMTQQIPYKMFNYAYSGTEEVFSLGDALYEIDYINDTESWVKISGLLLPGSGMSTTMTLNNLRMTVTDKSDAFIFKPSSSTQTSLLNFEARIAGSFMNPYYTFTTPEGVTVKAIAQSSGYLSSSKIFNAEDGTLNTAYSTEDVDKNRYYVQINEAHLSDSQRSLRIKLDYPSFPAYAKRQVNGQDQYSDLSVVVFKDIPFSIINNRTIQFAIDELVPSYSPDGTTLKDIEGYKVTDLTASGTLGGDLTISYNWVVPNSDKTEPATYKVMATLVQTLTTGNNGNN